MKLKGNYRLIFLSLLIIIFFATHVQANPRPNFIEIIIKTVFPFISAGDASNEAIFIARHHGNEKVSYQWEAYLLTEKSEIVKIVGPETESWTLKITMPTIVKVVARNEGNPFDFDVSAVKVVPENLALLSTPPTFSTLR